MLDQRLEGFDAGDEDHVEALKELAEIHHSRLLDIWGRYLDTYEGRMMVWELMDTHCPMFHSLSGMTNETMREKSGRRDVGLEIFGYIMTANPQAYLLMTSEAEQRTREAQRMFDEILEKVNERHD